MARGGAGALLNKSILNVASCFLLILHENFRATMRYLGRRFSVPKLCAVPPQMPLVPTLA